MKTRNLQQHRPLRLAMAPERRAKQIAANTRASELARKAPKQAPTQSKEAR